MYHHHYVDHWGVLTERTELSDFQLLRDLIPHGFFYGTHVWGQDRKLPLGYKNYLVMMEGCNTDWLLRESQRIGDSAQIFVLGMYRHYDFFIECKNVVYLPWFEWHYQLRRMYTAYGDITKNITHRISAMASRITQSKIVMFMALQQQRNCMLSMGTHFISKNVHDWIPTGRPRLDLLIDQYRSEWHGRALRIDHYDPQVMTAEEAHDYRVPAYSQCAINVNQESFHYSHISGRILPGPILTEKTLKCLISATPFLHNGQFESYDVLKQMGFEFDYGLDLSYDHTSGDLDRMLTLLEVLDSIQHLDAAEIYSMTKSSSEKNQQHVISGDFWRRCEQRNEATLDEILARRS